MSLQPVFQTLAIIQTTVLSIIIAIYALSTQIAADRFTTRIISSVTENSSYPNTILLFTASIFLDVLGLLIFPIAPVWLNWLLLLVAVLGVCLTFGSLFYLRDELLSTTEAPSVAEVIRNGISKEAFESAVGDDETTIPFYSFFEAGRSAIREEDKDAANQLVTALCESTSRLFKEADESEEALPDEQVTGLVQILSEEKSLADETIEQGYHGLTSYLIRSLASKIETSIEHGQDAIASHGVSLCSGISEEVIERGQLVKPAWLIWEDILESAAREGLEDTLHIGTSSVSKLIDIAVENSGELDSRNLTIAYVLLTRFLKGWNTLVANHGEHITEDDRVETAPEFLWYRFFERNFESTARIIVSHNADLQIPSAGMFKLQQNMLQELSNVAKSAAEVQNDYLTKRLAKMVIEAGLGFEDNQRTRRQIVSGLTGIKSTNDCGALAVQQALSELQTPAEVNDDDDSLMPITAPWVLNFINYTFEGEEGLIEAVSQIETEMSSGDTE
ncbi:hypothetical protein SY89_02726 [Halolamina pelagica]|uniref:DUF2254 domain-containing protein n=2 Tax=Halolamina pelagica TaxID=699431 RepID=A0A0P7H107_9EURY|nr:hypothetical protein SY89_02726 [Halolamina pelagica]